MRRKTSSHYARRNFTEHIAHYRLIQQHRNLTKFQEISLQTNIHVPQLPPQTSQLNLRLGKSPLNTTEADGKRKINFQLVFVDFLISMDNANEENLRKNLWQRQQHENGDSNQQFFANQYQVWFHFEIPLVITLMFVILAHATWWIRSAAWP